MTKFTYSTTPTGRITVATRFQKIGTFKTMPRAKVVAIGERERIAFMEAYRAGCAAQGTYEGFMAATCAAEREWKRISAG